MRNKLTEHDLFELDGEYLVPNKLFYKITSYRTKTETIDNVSCDVSVRELKKEILEWFENNNIEPIVEYTSSINYDHRYKTIILSEIEFQSEEDLVRFKLRFA